MSISVTRATPADVSDIVNVRQAAYTNDRLHQYGMPNPMSEEQKAAYRQYQLEAIKLRLEMSDRRYYFKAVDESSGRMVGFSC